MARYIDADALYKKLYPLDLADKRKYTINAKAVADAIANIPTADVVPKSEVERLEHVLNSYALQYGTVKDQHEVIDKAKSEVAREIFEEIESMAKNGIVYTFSSDFAELKKKYTEVAE